MAISPSMYTTAAVAPLPIADGWWYSKVKRAESTATATAEGTATVPASTAAVITAPASSVASTMPTQTAAGNPTPTTNSLNNSTLSWNYLQLAGFEGKTTGYPFPPWEVAAADYGSLCPHGNCLVDCQNVSRVFSPVPDGINISASSYGKAAPRGALPDITLFGVCSNLDTVSRLAVSQSSNNSAFANYFPTASFPGALRNVSNDISMCLIDTCQATRDPSQCLGYCSLDSLQITPTSVSVSKGVYPCLYKLCQNTCGLPYANQDVYGVGVLASYIMQAFLVLLLAFGMIMVASWHFFRNQKCEKSTIPKRMRESLDMFLAAECFFGISIAIASYRMSPSTIDPLNGYALLSVAITGFIPPVFTLMLLHSHGIKSIYTLLLTTVTWIVSSVLFWMLWNNLMKTIDDSTATNRGLNSLFPIDSCGMSSAMSICKQAFDTDPLFYLSWFYNYWNIPGIRTVPILWVLSAVVLFTLIVFQMIGRTRQKYQGLQQLEKQNQRSQLYVVEPRSKLQSGVALALLYLGTTLFGLALAYQASMVISYTRMDVIDWRGWTFGQVVAVLFWIPPIMDSIRAYFVESRRERSHKRLRSVSSSPSRGLGDNESTAYMPVFSLPGDTTKDDGFSINTNDEKNKARDGVFSFSLTSSPQSTRTLVNDYSLSPTKFQSDSPREQQPYTPSSNIPNSHQITKQGSQIYMEEPIYAAAAAADDDQAYTRSSSSSPSLPTSPPPRSIYRDQHLQQLPKTHHKKNNFSLPSRKTRHKPSKGSLNVVQERREEEEKRDSVIR